MDGQVKEPSLPTYQTVSAQLVLQGTAQSVLTMEWLIVPCLHDEFFHARKPLLCGAIWAGFVVGVGREKRHWKRSARKGCRAIATGCRELDQHSDCCPGHCSLPCQAPEAMQTC